MPEFDEKKQSEELNNFHDNLNPFSMLDDRFIDEMTLYRLENNMPAQYADKFEIIKDQVIFDEMFNPNDEDVLGDIDVIMENIPDNYSTLEKMRWLYINLGKLFSYDFRIANNPQHFYDKQIDMNDYVGRYQTCVQISQIIPELFYQIPGVLDCGIVDRNMPDYRGQYNHKANYATFYDDFGEERTILLDLTLDLFRIQAGCQTYHFGFESEPSKSYDIIPLTDDIKMDIKMGLVLGSTSYTDYEVMNKTNLIKNIANNEYGNNPEKMLEKKISIISTLRRDFPGYHEGKMYVNYLFDNLLNADTKSDPSAYLTTDYKEYNVYFYENEHVNLKTIYRINCGPLEQWLIFSTKVGFIRTDKDKVRKMLNEEWKSNSVELYEILGIERENTRK